MDDLQAFYGPNAGYVLDLYDKYVQDPASVDAGARAFFAQLSQPGGPDGTVEEHDQATAATGALSALDVERVARLSWLAATVRSRGHTAARLDPLGSTPHSDPNLDPANTGVTERDLEELPASVVDGPVAVTARNAGEAIEALRRIYCQTTGYDYAHIQVAEERAWLRDAVETGRFHQPLDVEEQRALLERLTEVDAFELFLHRAFTGQKRFSIEGTDMLVPMLDTVIRNAALDGTHDVALGMAHRGRLNVLAHVLNKPYAQIFSEFQHRSHTAAASEHFAHYGWTGDVKYHLGARRTWQEGETVRAQITLAPNPSHLEFINPVIQGMTRALQETRDRPGAPRQQTAAALALLIHGDAAFPGEGIVAESLNLSQLAGYRIGGVIHIIANNQLGFTTTPTDGRSTLYASDLAKGYEIPIVHVNADDPEACLAAARLAYAYHHRFHKDFLIDLVGYRRWGHNEADEPAFTQPRLYELIRSHPSARALWAERLDREGVVPLAEAKALLETALARLQAVQPEPEPAVDDEQPQELSQPAVVTAVPEDHLRAYNESLLHRPEGFTPNAKLERLLQNRRNALETDGSIDWAHAESLAFASLLADGTPIRLTGQDAERGTFSQRHLVLHDADTGDRYVPLQEMPESRASFAVFNSPLSESAPLGFEYGYSGSTKDALVLWEAQYGDFANAAQVIIDQFISAARAKWRERPWLVLLLPHGYEGQGPEHSSGRLERYLQLAGGDNLRVANCTTAAQYFHLLRRQVALSATDPRPLVVMTPKGLLREKLASSRLQDLTDGTFQPVIDDAFVAGHREHVTRLILCSGRVYVDLVKDAGRAAADRVAIVRVEELYPFPGSALGSIIGAYPRLRELIWLQEEPKNMGAWSYMAPRLRDLVGREPSIDYIGRPERASPAEGSAPQHAGEQSRIVAEALSNLQGPSPAAREVRQHAG
ncbi:MAG TPA: 2-oxoglutarate dehydrogenase E1 component [Chloroflexota bacterium]|nr:2-oxoglutarate dehydrogenase E1 component [Chloroflexota bacterium]